MEFHHIVPQDGDMDGETEGNEEHPSSPDPPIWSEVLIIPYALLHSASHLCAQSQRYATMSLAAINFDTSFEIVICR